MKKTGVRRRHRCTESRSALFKQRRLGMKRVVLTLIGLGIAALTALPLPGMAAERLRLTTTRSVYQSGLLTAVNPSFEAAHKVKIEVTALGSGKALQRARRGKADILLLPASPATEAFIAAGEGVDSHVVMHSEFVIVGPEADPARVREAATAPAAFQRIAQSKAPFVSSREGTATRNKETAIWHAAAMSPRGGWYLRTDQHAGPLLLIADDKQAYTLSNRETCLSYKGKIDLPILLKGDPVLRKPYQAIAVDPDGHPGTKLDLARKYIEFLRGPEARRLIADFRLAGEPLFYPDADSKP